jgi:NhaA family Na+:H+ antiporter
VSFAIVPLFALANAGVSLDGQAVRDAAGSAVTLGVVLGLLIGKPVGILLTAWLAVRFAGAHLPSGATWRGLAGVAVVGGVGFTVSLFVAGLAFDSAALQANAKVGVLAASLVAGVAGWTLLRLARPPSAGEGA